ALRKPSLVLRWLACRFARHRQPDKEYGVSWSRFEFNLSPVAVGHDAIADDQPEPGPFADPLRGKKRLKEVRANIFRDACSVIVDLHENLMIFAPRSDSHFSLSIHRVDGVI